MVDHLEVSEDEAVFGILEYVGADAAVIKRWYPDLFSNDDCINQATLDVTD